MDTGRDVQVEHIVIDELDIECSSNDRFWGQSRASSTLHTSTYHDSDPEDANPSGSGSGSGSSVYEKRETLDLGESTTFVSGQYGIDSRAKKAGAKAGTPFSRAPKRTMENSRTYVRGPYNKRKKSVREFAASWSSRACERALNHSCQPNSFSHGLASLHCYSQTAPLRPQQSQGSGDLNAAHTTRKKSHRRPQIVL